MIPPLWQAARALLEPNHLSIPEWLSDWGLYLFYAAFTAIFLLGLIKRDTNLINITLAYVKAQLIFSLYCFLPLIYAFLIAASRVFVSSHYPSDVAAGTAIGILGAWLFIDRLPDRSP